MATSLMLGSNCRKVDSLVSLVTVCQWSLDIVLLVWRGLACGDGLLRRALARCQRRSVSPLRVAIPRAIPSDRWCRRECQQRTSLVPGDAGLVSFTLRVNEARLTNLPSFRSRRCASFAARRSDCHPVQPPCPMPGR